MTNDDRGNKSRDTGCSDIIAFFVLMLIIGPPFMRVIVSYWEEAFPELLELIR